jgi:hypothetical protein
MNVELLQQIGGKGELLWTLFICLLRRKLFIFYMKKYLLVSVVRLA